MIFCTNWITPSLWILWEPHNALLGSKVDLKHVGRSKFLSLPPLKRGWRLQTLYTVSDKQLVSMGLFCVQISKLCIAVCKTLYSRVDSRVICPLHRLWNECGVWRTKIDTILISAGSLGGCVKKGSFSFEEHSCALQEVLCDRRIPIPRPTKTRISLVY